MANRGPGWSLNATPEQLLEAMGGGKRQQRMAIRAAAEVLRGEWIETLSGPGRGRWYEAGLRFFTRGGRVIPITDRSDVQRTRAGHRASAPGDAPAKDSGGSASSIAVDDSDPDSLRVGTNRRSLVALQWGVGTPDSRVAEHPGGITILPRPHADVAIEEAKPRMRQQARRILGGERK